MGQCTVSRDSTSSRGKSGCPCRHSPVLYECAYIDNQLTRCTVHISQLGPLDRIKWAVYIVKKRDFHKFAYIGNQLSRRTVPISQVGPPDRIRWAIVQWGWDAFGLSKASHQSYLTAWLKCLTAKTFLFQCTVAKLSVKNKHQQSFQKLARYTEPRRGADALTHRHQSLSQEPCHSDALGYCHLHRRSMVNIACAESREGFTDWGVT